MKIRTNTTPVVPLTITETLSSEESRSAENHDAPKTKMELRGNENTARHLLADAYMKKDQEDDTIANVPSDVSTEADDVGNSQNDMPEQTSSELTEEVHETGKEDPLHYYKNSSMLDSEERLPDDNPSVVERSALENKDVIVGTDDRTWYLAMVSTGGTPVRDLHPNELFGVLPDDEETVAGAGKL